MSPDTFRMDGVWDFSAGGPVPPDPAEGAPDRYYLEDHPDYRLGQEWGAIVEQADPGNGKAREYLLRLCGQARASLDGDELMQGSLDILAEAARDPRTHKRFTRNIPGCVRTFMECEPPGFVRYIPQEGEHLGEVYFGSLRVVRPAGEDAFLTVIYTPTPFDRSSWRDRPPGVPDDF